MFSYIKSLAHKNNTYYTLTLIIHISYEIKEPAMDLFNLHLPMIVSFPIVLIAFAVGFSVNNAISKKN